jgi:hypothetical protein
MKKLMAKVGLSAIQWTHVSIVSVNGEGTGRVIWREHFLNAHGNPPRKKVVLAEHLNFDHAKIFHLGKTLFTTDNLQVFICHHFVVSILPFAMCPVHTGRFPVLFACGSPAFHNIMKY